MLAIRPTYHRTNRFLALLAATVSATLLCAGVASASSLVITGGGDGHGVGMSQQGALGYAEHGLSYRAILAHYYSGTAIGSAPAGAQVRVLIGGQVHRIPLETYVRGVVSAEVPSSWPLAALEAQAVASRTYALTAHAGLEVRRVRRHALAGLPRRGRQTPQTDAAVTATAGQIVTYQGRPAITFFFASSGGRTENIENSFTGSQPAPWLRGVVDQYERGDLHSWTLTLSFAAAAARLRGLVRGSFKGIEVLKRGFSPRILSADVLGSGGRTPVSGPELAARLGLYSSWAYFSTRDGQSLQAQPDRSGWSSTSSPAPAAPPATSTAQGGVPPAPAAEAASSSAPAAGEGGGTAAPG